MNKNEFDGNVEVSQIMRIKQRLNMEGQSVYNNLGFPTISNYERDNKKLIKKLTVLDIDFLNTGQREIFDTIVSSVDNGESKLVCLNTSGGTGKTYTINMIIIFLLKIIKQ